VKAYKKRYLGGGYQLAAWTTGEALEKNTSFEVGVELIERQRKKTVGRE